jgi:hypothetical protein
MPFAYHFDDLPDRMVTLVFRDGTDACVGRVYSKPDDGADRWMAELGKAMVMTPFPSRDEALAAVCAYADRNPHLAV